MTSKLKKHFAISVVLVLWFVVVAFNYTPGTWLLGWDNLVPEFNFKLNIFRSLSAVWQEYQGLGLLGGMAHAADLPRQIILLLTSVVLPQNLLRYFWTFLMLLLGPLGVYFLSSSFLASAFYLLNFATVQTFFVPFETFTSFYGFLPWLIYFALKYLNGSNLKKFLIVSLLGACAFYVQTMFVVYGIVLGVFVLDYLFRRGKIGRVLKLGLAVFVINAFWLLPVLWFSIYGSGVLFETKTGVIPTVEQKLMNQNFGDLGYIARLQGFWLNYTDANVSNTKFDYLMPVWRDWLSKGSVEIVQYALFGLALLGTGWGVIKKKERALATAMGLLICLLMLSGKIDFGAVPIVGQMFRSAFTKFSIPLAFFMALGLGYLEKFFGKHLKFILVGFLFVGMVWQVKPVFEGQMINPAMRVESPSQYQDLFKFFNLQPKQARVARFPVQTFWGWDFYSWGGRGSGFLWYGISQPILDRAFDVWSLNDQFYYQEISRALYGGDKDNFERVLKKYDVSYALLDESVVVPQGDEKILRYSETKQMLGDIGGEKVFEEGFLKVYRLPWASKSFISSGDLNNENIIYPFSNLFQEKIDNVEYNNGYVKLSNAKNILNVGGKYRLNMPAMKIGQKVSLSARASFDGKQIKIDFNPFLKISDYELDLPDLYINTKGDFKNIIFYLGGKKFGISKGETKDILGMNFSVGEPIEVNVFDDEGKKSLDLSREFLSQEVNKCWVREGESGFVDSTSDSGVVKITTKDAAGCLSFKLDGIKNALVEVNLPFFSENGARPHFCIQKEGELDCENKEVFYSTLASENWGNVSRESVLGNNTYWLSVAARPSDEVGKTWTIFYKTPQVSYLPEVASYVVDTEFWNEMEKESNLEVSGNIYVQVSSSAEEINLSTNEIKNCDLFGRGSVNREILDGVLYVADGGGVECESKFLDELTTKGEYLLRFVGDNIEGRSVKFYLYNQVSGRNDLEELLPSNKFDTFYGVLNWPFLKEGKYTLSFETRSFGEKSMNRIDKVEAYSVPLSWLSSFEIMPEGEKRENNLEIGKTGKFGTGVYKVSVKGSGVIKLSQAYESGWQAIQISNNKLQMPKRLEHVEVDGWANGFAVNSKAQIPNDKISTIYIFYWPQVLEWVGLVLLTGVFLYFIMGYFKVVVRPQKK